jgi:phosphatidylglycerol:prolipoprotein diacylglycerol transferase
MPTPDRVAFSIAGFDIMWYGIIIAVAIAVVIVISWRRAPKYDLVPDKTLNYAIIIVLAGIVGARIYYVVFNWSYYKQDLGMIFQFREGGLAIHGGLIFGALALVIMSRIWKDHPLNLLDLYFAAFPLGQAIGRWGNYFNGEAHGGQTDLPWGVIIGGVKYHPTFLYESIWCALLFVFLMWMGNRRRFKGQIFLLSCMLYSLERFFVEWLRTDSLRLFGVKQAMLLSALVMVGGAVAYYLLWKRSKSSGSLDVRPENLILTEAGTPIVAVPDEEEGIPDNSPVSNGQAEDATSKDAVPDAEESVSNNHPVSKGSADGATSKDAAPKTGREDHE